MHIAIARFPAVPAERDKDFRDWFAWSNDQLRGMVGLRGRRLLRAPDGSYTALVEHDSAGAFAAMHKAEAVSMIHRGLGRILNDRRQAVIYDVLVDFPTAETCCCEGHGTCSCEGAASEPGLGLVSGGAVPAAVSCDGDNAGRP
jgi:heme-degrading monooxygenase HmoA